MGEISQANPDDSPWRLRVATYNIHGCIGTDGERDLPRVARVLSVAVPDVIGLNEVYRYFAGAAQDEKLAAQLGPGWTAVFGKTINKPLAQYGNAILTRLPVVSSESWLLDEFPGQERRGLMRVTVRKGKRLIHVFCTHLGLHGLMRERSALQIIDIIKRFRDGDCILMGDFNETVPAAGLAVISKAGLTDAWSTFGLSPGKTFPSRPTLRRLDYIWLGDGLAAESCYVGAFADARSASDHRPLFATLVAHDDIQTSTTAADRSEKAGVASAIARRAVVVEDFDKVPGSETPRWWHRIGARIRRDNENAGFGGVAIAGGQHFWRQKSGGELIYERKADLPGCEQFCVGARIQMVTAGDGWTLGMGGAGARIRHELGELPILELRVGEHDIISSTSLTALNVDPYSWNNYVLRVGPENHSAQNASGSSDSNAMKLHIYINGVQVLHGTYKKESNHPDPETFWLKTDGGGAGNCEIFADDFVVWPAQTDRNFETLIKELYPLRVIRKAASGERVWWLDLW